jgi:SAM-dependent methyltransferase
MEKQAATLNDVQDFWNSRPCNIRHSEAEIGTKKYFDEVEARKYFVEPHIMSFANFPNWNGKRVLEIGCGIGTDAINFARAGADYTGVELSSESLKLTKTRFEVFGLPGRLFVGDAESLVSLFPNETFDLIYSFGVLHHTPNLIKALESISELSNDSTIVKVMVYAESSWKNALIKAGLEQPEAQSGCPIANTYTNSEIRLAFEKAGLIVTDIKQDHIFPYKVADYKKYKYEVEDWFKLMPKEMFEALERQLGWHLLIDAKKLIK